MNVAIYARVSTVAHGQDPELQLRELRAHCLRQGWCLIRTEVDQVSSSKTRPNLEKLLAAADNKEFDAIIVWKFDRVARSAIELCTILARLQKAGVGFTSLTEQIDTSTAAGKLVFTVLGAVAEMERSLIQERVKAGLRNAMAKGQHVGRPKTKVTPATAKRMVDTYNGNILQAALALKLSYSTVRTLIRRRS